MTEAGNSLTNGRPSQASSGLRGIACTGTPDVCWLSTL
ncbi:Uncharacterised protein [Bordetella pertussis]|nr:Uncharacterised protein [Bordetella pertussis]CFW39761.1 Uncharacterised protein [Bordetella pertussis]